MSAITGLPHFVLHFDVNRTLIMSDGARGSDRDQLLVASMAESRVAEWEPGIKKSFANYVRENLVPGDRLQSDVIRDLQFKEITGLISWLEKSSIPERQEILKEYAEARESLYALEGIGVFPSFYNLLERLKTSQAQFSLVLRSFGKELGPVVSHISDHPNSVTINRSDCTFESKQFHIGDRTISNISEIFELFLSGEHMAVQDSHADWKAGEYRGHMGKPFIYDETCGLGSRVRNLSLFFDDGITGMEKDIVCPIEIRDDDAVAIKEKAQARSSALLNRMLFRVDALKALQSETYFIDLVNVALRANGFRSYI